MKYLNWFNNNTELTAERDRYYQTLENSANAFMIADNDLNIIYVNKSVVSLLTDAEADIRKELPQFSVKNLVGTNIDNFHKNPAHQRNMLSRLSQTHTSQIKIGRRTFKLFLSPIIDNQNRHLGTSVEWIDFTQTLINEVNAKRMMTALHGTTTNIMIADAERKIIYMNTSVEAMLRRQESELRKALPHFAVDKVIGSSIDIFHKNPAHQMNLLDKLTGTHEAQIKVGRLHFKLVANPIFDGETRLGTSVEWLDRTAEVEAEIEVSSLVEAAGKGNFTKRIVVEGKEGFILSLAERLNALMEVSGTSLQELADMLNALADGDLTNRIETDYSGTFGELKDFSNSTAEKLSQMISEIAEAADTIKTASEEIATGNADLSSRTEEQAASLEQTASSIEQLNSTVRLNSENANQASTLASSATKVASEGGDLIDQVTKTMAQIKESSEKIADIIGVIDGIAFQTNILALNAAVEAARAGEQGRGFAVVASEVRTLAQRSANAAKDIKGLISDSVSKIANGNALVDKSGATMKEIVVSIKRVNDIMSEIAAASAEQAAGIDEVSKAVSQMDEVTQQNAALVEEAAAAAESMSSQASQLSLNVASFKILGAPEPRAIGLTAKAAPKKQLAAPLKKATKSPVKVAKSEPKALKAKPSDEDEWNEF
ncbi:methyl-accepting chemotaxis protein [Rheinheimera sp. UJ51]|uniref:methyl-accepting chemotaxis protein n=1 Tax=Rheinheimera sp. UJ51 TaxID=2892446 RepID=UPI002D1FAC26|nr:methyl-accepting chemotaxis protein [Rheinheimera sp. UJ51]